MRLHVSWLLILIAFQKQVHGEYCPRVCSCEFAPLSQLPISSVLVRVEHSHPSEEQQRSYHQRNEVLDEKDEHQVHHQLGEEKLEAATCVLQPEDNSQLLQSLPSSLQVLTLLQGPGSQNITLDDSHFQHLLNLVVLEVHGYRHGKTVLKVRSNAFKNLGNLQYLNIQHLHLLGNGSIGNRPVPISVAAYSKDSQGNSDSNDILGSIQLIRAEPEIVPYSVYKEQQERDGLTAFTGLKNLVFLRAFHCNIKEVSWEMFDGLQQLEYLSLEGNNIPFLNEFAFYGTPNLKHLTMSHNNLLQVQSTDLAGLLKLKTLDLSYNNISHLSELSLPPLPELVMADFHHNPIEHILPNTFEIMNETELLFLGGNHARLQVHPNSFSGLVKLHKLSLNGIKLNVLESNYFKGMTKLKELRLEGVIHELAFDAFAEVPKLVELIMKRCSIYKISMDAFFGLYGLVYLDLSYNELESLPPSLFDHQNNLKEINLSNNKLKTLPDGIFTKVPAKLIRLDKNPWHCTCTMHEWQPSQINKVKIKIIDNSECQTRYDKGSMCKVRYMNQYVFEQSVSPKCATPSRFAGWSVFHLLRKHLRCHEKLHKYKVQWQNDKIKTSKNNKMNYNNTILNKTKTESKLTANDQTAETFVTLRVPLASDAMTHKNSEQTTELIKNTTNQNPTIKTELETSDDQDNVLNSNNALGSDDYLWTKKDKDKFKLLQEKEGRILKRYNDTAFVQREKAVPPLKKVPATTNSKPNKKSDTSKKWEIKMDNTMRRLNLVPGNNHNIP